MRSIWPGGNPIQIFPTDTARILPNLRKASIGEDSPEPSESVNIGGKTYTKTFIDLSGGSKAEKIDKLCGLINMILKPADPVVKHGTLVAVQTMLCEKEEDSLEPVLQAFHDTMGQYFDKYRSYLTDEQKQNILSAFE